MVMFLKFCKELMFLNYKRSKVVIRIKEKIE